MNQTDIPAAFPIPFANNAGGSYIRPIPQPSQAVSGSDAPASLYDGFPPVCFQTIGSGGIPPNGKDFNGLLNQITAWSRWQAAGAPAVFNSAFCTAIGGYPKGAMLVSTAAANVIWISTADGNTTNPDGGSPANWETLEASYGQNANGWWEKRRNGIIVQGGAYRASLNEGAVSVSFPIPFINGVQTMQATAYNANADMTKDKAMQRGTATLTTGNFYVQAMSTQTGLLDGFDWEARGS